MIKTFLEQLGGAPYVAKRLQEMSGKPCKKGSVYQWPYQNCIPERWQPYVIRLAQEERVTLPPDLQPLADLQNATLPTQPVNDSDASKSSSKKSSIDLSVTAEVAQ